MKKKNVLASLILAGAMFLTACGGGASSTTAASGGVSGSYTGTAKGMGGDVSVTLTLTTECYPEVTLGQYKGLEVEKMAVTVSDGQVAAELDRMAQNVASTETVEREAQMGDTANIDFEGFDNGVAFDGGKGEDFDLKLGSGQFVPGFAATVGRPMARMSCLATATS